MRVLESINELLYPTDQESQRNANTFLTKWQQTIEAWTESHSILHGDFPPEAKFIAAQTLRMKVLYDSYQLPSHCVLKLCESLLAYLNNDDLP
ncbi:hypothetical protein BEWA_023770 [Theileria equi strain WA]|uniref:Importin N-terminal domain-containing protein n=1 Tax=Theileria equi strain WA TaxID=1537102 RepID=L0AWB1_THEEQ|nr:hypothetical protein BEWA_023770 [Theileria equi strain WA]AFZ79528.1 hypothetical protein BEWA_023770 [Theileria equi strain WA]|eukprot:XP_004829194.1 hypothetical protein BEWA_023770 [Theileria equi strain WA]